MAIAIGSYTDLKSRAIAWCGDIHQCTRLSDRLKAFTSDELAEIIFRMDLAGAIEPLPPEAETLLNEFVEELRALDAK
jgi:hypothetical protein